MFILVPEVVTMRRGMLLLAVLIFFSSLAFGYASVRKNMPKPDAQEVLPPMEQATKEETVIGAQAEIVYQYYYTEDQITVEQIEPVQDFMTGLSLQQVQSIYHGWQVVFFSQDKVILRCSVEGRSDESFLLGEKDGFLAVFIEKKKKTPELYECTDIPLSILPETERQQIQEGVSILGEENLAKILSDYMS